MGVLAGSGRGLLRFFPTPALHITFYYYTKERAALVLAVTQRVALGGKNIVFDIHPESNEQVDDDG